MLFPDQHRFFSFESDFTDPMIWMYHNLFNQSLWMGNVFFSSSSSKNAPINILVQVS